MKPAFILGIDGLPYTLAKRLISEGLMPNLAELSKIGSLAQLHTTVPDFSCVAWTSFATGVNPGRHGIYGFQDFHPKDGHDYLPDVNDCQATALWHEVGNAGGRSIIFNLPNTYPALPLRGKMVSGFIATEFDKSFYPPMFAQTMKSLGYRMDLDGIDGLGRPENVFESLFPVFEARKTAIRHLITNEYWDLCVAVITETDRLQHYFLHTLDDPEHPQHEWTKTFYIELDKFIGEVVELLDGKADLYMVSDHGFEVIRHEILVEDFLRDLGLAPPSEHPCWQSPEIASKTPVLSLDPGRFYINAKGSRFPHGFVEPGEVPGILQTIKDALLALVDPKTGEKMVSTVRLKNEAFWGNAIDYAPDLVAATNPGYYFKSFRYPESSDVIESCWEANHVWSDAIVYTPNKIQAGYQPMIWDVLPTALENMGITLHDDIDGRNIAARPLVKAASQ